MTENSAEKRLSDQLEAALEGLNLSTENVERIRQEEPGLLKLMLRSKNFIDFSNKILELSPKAFIADYRHFSSFFNARTGARRSSTPAIAQEVRTEIRGVVAGDESLSSDRPETSSVESQLSP